MDDGNGTNQRRNLRQNYEEDDRSTNRRRQTNEMVNEPQNGDDDEQIPLSLTLGSTSYSSQPQIPPVTSSLRLVPPPAFAGPMTTWPSHADLMQRMMDSNPFMTSSRYLPSSSMSNNSLHQTGSQPIQPPLSFFPASGYGPPSNQTIPEIPVVRPTVRSSRSQSTGNNDNTIPPPFPWATNIKGKIHSLEYLEAKQITTITGDVQCKYCEKVYQVSYNLRERFKEIERIFTLLRKSMRERAPPMWTTPELRRCELCGREKAVKPVIADRKRLINWLFMLLGQSLGFCTLEQLKNFCKHSKNHRTGAKDRVLYLTYLGLCKMLQPNRALFTRGNVRG